MGWGWEEGKGKKGDHMDWLLARMGPCRLLYQSEQNEG